MSSVALQQPMPLSNRPSNSISRAAPSAVRTSLQRIGDMLLLIERNVPIAKRIVHAGDVVYQAGQQFECLYVVNAGFFKMVNLSIVGREHVVGLHLKGDWLGLDGLAASQYGCDAIAMDTGELWIIRYDDLLRASLRTPALLTALHQTMSRELVREQNSMLSICSLPADARVAGFLRYWAEALAQRGLRTDQFTLRMTRAEMGNYLGMTLESVSRALSRLARGNVIRFSEKGRRDIHIPHLEALTAFMQRGSEAVAVH